MYTEIKELIGKTLVKIEQIDKEEIIFTTSEGDKYKMYHEQDCCESVEIDDVNGDYEDLLNTRLNVAEERTNENLDDDGDFSQTWTFYEFRTRKGSVNIKWLGESNGYYSESVEITKM